MTQVSRSAFTTNLTNLIPTNSAGEVSAADIRSVLTDLEDSATWYDEANIVFDLTPQLGGSLDVNGQSIISTSNGNITIAPNGTGDIVLGTVTVDADITVGASQDGYVWTYDHTVQKMVLSAPTGGGGGGATELADLTDVGSTTATNRNVLVADGNSWESRALTEADISDLGTYLADITGESIGDLSDVTLTAAAQGDVLYRNATGWVNLGAGTSGQFLQTQGVGSNPQWATPAGSGNVSNTGTPIDNQIAVWTASTVVEGTSGLTYSGSTFSVTGNIVVSGTVDGRDVAADGIKLDSVESGANVTDAANVETSIEAISYTAVTPASGDQFLIIDATDGGLKSVNYSTFFTSLVEDTTPQLGGNLDVNSFGITFPGATVTDVTGADTTLVSGTAGASGDLSVWNADGDLVDGPTPPSGAIVGTSDTQTLTNKTINGDNNTITNLDIGLEVEWASITDVVDASAFTSGDKVLIYEAGVGMRKVDYDDLPSGVSGIQNVVEDTTPQLGGSLDGQGNRITGFLGNTPGNVSGTLTAASHGGGVHVTSGNVTIPTTAGFQCVLIAGGAHTVTFNGTTSAAMSSGDIMSVVVQSSSVVHAVLTESSNKVTFS